MPTLTIIDKTTFDGGVHTLTLDFLTETTTVREIIRSRVYEEVHHYNVRSNDVFRGLVQPTDAEVTLNDFRLRKQRQIDWEAQYERALEAFVTNGFLLLIDDRQVDDLDEVIELRQDMAVHFLRLVPLVGG